MDGRAFRALSGMRLKLTRSHRRNRRHQCDAVGVTRLHALTVGWTTDNPT
jgi:hypothetical protein